MRLRILVLIFMLALALLLSACLNENTSLKAQETNGISASSKTKPLEEPEVDLRVTVKVNVKDLKELRPKIQEAQDLPFDLRQDFFEAYKTEAWPELPSTVYGDMPYQVLFDGFLGEDSIKVISHATGQALSLSPATAKDDYSTHASLVSTSLTDKVPANFFWFEVDITTQEQLRDAPNLWERGWIAWNLERNTDLEQRKILREAVPYTFYYFYVKESDTTFPGIEVGKLEPGNPETWDCSFDVPAEIAQPNIDCDNDGDIDDVIYGAQRFFPFRFDPNEPMHESGDCLVMSQLPRFGFGVGKTHTFRILHHQDSFEIYWLRTTLSGETIAQKLLSCQDLLNPYTQGAIGFYTEDATVVFDNFRLQAFEFAVTKPELEEASELIASEPDESDTQTLSPAQGPFGVSYQSDFLEPSDLPNFP